MWQWIKKEKNDSSKWFKWSFSIIFCVYLISWAFTIHLSRIQIQNNMEPVLPTIPQDSEEYEELSRSILEEGKFWSGGALNTLRAPGYPFFVAATKKIADTYFLTTLVQIILVFLSAIIIRKLGKHFYSVKCGEISAFLFLINPLVLVLSLVILTDMVFLFIFLLGFYLAITNSRGSLGTVVYSLIFALAIYIRPMGIFAVPIFILPIIISNLPIKEKIRSAILMCLIIIIAVMPWIYRNYKQTNVPDFTSFKAINLADYAAPLFSANRNGTSLEVERKKIETLTGLNRGEWTNLKNSKIVSDVAIDIITEHPFEYLAYHLTSSLSYLFSSSIQDSIITYRSAMHIGEKYEAGAINYLTSGEWKLFLNSITAVWWKIGERFIWVAVYLIALFALWMERKKSLSWAFIFVPIYLMVLAGPAANARYAIQGLPFVLILFSVGVFQLSRVFRTKINSFYNKNV